MDDVIQTGSAGNLVYMAVNGRYTSKFMLRGEVDQTIFDRKLIPKLQPSFEEPLTASIVNDQLHYTSGKFTLMIYEEDIGPMVRREPGKLILEFNTYDDSGQEEIISAEKQDVLIDKIEEFVGEVIGRLEAPVQRQLDFGDAPIEVFARRISESDLGGSGYEGEFELSPLVKQLLYKPNIRRGEDGVLVDKAVQLIREKLNGALTEQFFHVSQTSDEGTEDELTYDEFTSNIVNGGELTIKFEMHATPYLYLLCYNAQNCADIKLKEKTERVLKDVVTELQSNQRQLDFGDAPIEDEQPLDEMIQDRDDPRLTFYERIGPMFVFDEIVATPQPMISTVFDQEMSETLSLSDFVLPGNKLVFLFGGQQTGISYLPFVRNIAEGNGIFYECKRVFPFNPTIGQLGTFEFNEIYAQPYIELALTSRYYISAQDFEKLLHVPIHPYWEIKDTGKTLKAAASRSSVIAGGPIQSQLHCQDGSDLKVYTIEPYMPTRSSQTEQPSPACELPKIVTLQRGEDRTQVDISDNNTVLGAKTWYAREKSLNVSTLKFIFSGKILKDEDVLTPGTVVLVMGGTGGRRTYRRRNLARKTSKK